MIFTADQLAQCKGWFAELEAQSISSFPSEFGIATGNDEINRVFRIDISDSIGFGIAFMRQYHTASVIPDDNDPAGLPADQWTVTDPLVDTVAHEGEYRHTMLRVYRQEQDGMEYFFVVQTLAKGFETDVTRTYVREVDNEALPVPDLTGMKFYDSGVEFNDVAVMYGEGDNYAMWTHATLGAVITTVADIGQTPTNYFLLSGGTYTGTGTWTGTFTLTTISETVADFSKFRIATADYYHASRSTPVLRLENVAPSAVHDICMYLNQETFTDIVYFDDTLDGTWYRVRVRSEVQEDGSYHVFILLSFSANMDFYFPWQVSENERAAEFIKLHIPPDLVRDFLDTYYFDTDFFYVSDDGGATYINKSGTEATGAMPATAKRLNEPVAGRFVNISPQPDNQTSEVSISVSIQWASDATESVFIHSDSFGNIFTSIQLMDVDEAAAGELISYLYIDSSGNAYYSENGTSYTRKNGSAVSPALALPVGSMRISNVSAEGRSLRLQVSQIQQTRRWNVDVSVRYFASDTRCSYLNDDTRLSYKPGSLSSVTMDQAYNITHAELVVAMLHYNSSPADGTTRRISTPQKNPETGLYSYEAIEISKTKVAASFQIGSEKVYLGYNYPKKPTTDIALFNADNPEAVGLLPESDNYYLVGAEWVSGAWTCLIDKTSAVSGIPQLDEETNTWSWQIRHSTEDAAVTGPADPVSGHEDYIFQSGDAMDFQRFVGRYPAQTIELGVLSLLSYFENIPANTFGTHPALVNRRKVIPFIRSERIVDGKLYYDVWEQVRTPDINDNDAWFTMGCTESLDRQKRDIASELINADGNKFSVTLANGTAFSHLMSYPDGTIDSNEDVNSDDVVNSDDFLAGGAYPANPIPIIAQLQAATKRRKTVLRQRKYFARRPTDSDLSSTYDSGTTTLKAAMDAVANKDTDGSEPSSLSAITFDVVDVGNGFFAVEKLSLLADDEFYRDDDAFDHFKDSDGNSVLGMQIQLVHMQTTDHLGVTIDPTVADADKLHLRTP